MHPRGLQKVSASGFGNHSGVPKVPRRCLWNPSGFRKYFGDVSGTPRVPGSTYLGLTEPFGVFRKYLSRTSGGARPSECEPGSLLEPARASSKDLPRRPEEPRRSWDANHWCRRECRRSWIANGWCRRERRRSWIANGWRRRERRRSWIANVGVVESIDVLGSPTLAMSGASTLRASGASANRTSAPLLTSSQQEAPERGRSDLRVHSGSRRLPVSRQLSDLGGCRFRRACRSPPCRARRAPRRRSRSASRRRGERSDVAHDQRRRLVSSSPRRAMRRARITSAAFVRPRRAVISAMGPSSGAQSARSRASAKRVAARSSSES